MSMLDEQIEEAINKGTFVDIYRDNLTGTETVFGQIKSVSEKLLYAAAYSDSGDYDGITIIRKSDITRLRWGGNERGSCEKLVRKKSVKSDIPQIDLTSFRTAMEDINREYHYVTVHVEEIDDEMCFIGEVLKIDDSHLLLHEYGTSKTLDRSKMLINLKDITMIQADGQYERDLMFLFERE